MLVKDIYERVSGIDRLIELYSQDKLDSSHIDELIMVAEAYRHELMNKRIVEGSEKVESYMYFR